MKEIRHIQARYAAAAPDEQLALATVVRVEGSAYRRVGARMLVSSRGDWVGGISGGCLEGDALRRAQAAIRSTSPSVVTYDTRDDDAHQIGVGLGCNGIIDVLFAPVRTDAPDNPLVVLRRQVTTRTPRVLVQCIGGAAPDGRLYEAAELEAVATTYGITPTLLNERLAVVRRAGGSRVFALATADEDTSVKLLFEYLRPEMRLFVVGDNYDVTALGGLSNQLGWELHVIGTVRKVSKALFQLATSVRAYARVSELRPDAYTAVLLMSHDYRRDLEMLRYFLPLQPRYLGLLGPRKRTVKLQTELDADLLGYAHTHSPVGLDIGAESPEEIALAILAEIVSVFRRRDARPLRERRGPIHAPAPETAVLLLAAGRASRMGQAKQLLPWAGTTLLGHAIRGARQLPGTKVYVVTGAYHTEVAAEARRHGAAVVRNPDFAAGMGSSIAVGVRAIQRELPAAARVLILLADQPFVGAAHREALLAAVSDPTGVAATPYETGRRGVPAVFGAAHFAALANLSGDRGARALLQGRDVKTVAVAAAQLIDLDTPERYAEYVPSGPSGGN